MHGEVGRPESAWALLPCCAPRGGDHRLQHRRVNCVEWRRLIVTSGGEGGGGDDCCGCETRERVVYEGACIRVFQARNEKRCRSKPARGQRRAQHVDRSRIGGEQSSAVEQDRHDGSHWRKRRLKLVERDGASARQVTSHARESLRLLSLEWMARMGSETAKQTMQILAPAFAEIGEQRNKLVGR